MTRSTVVALVVGCLSTGAGCGRSPAAPTAPVTFDLPPRFVLEAQAAATVDGRHIDCRIRFEGELARTDDGYRGVMGGETERSVTSTDGSGVAFHASAYYPDIRVSGSPMTGLATLRAFMNGAPWAPDGQSRFWDGLLGFAGDYDVDSDSISGDWLCRPIDAGSDTTGDIPGRWALYARP